MFRNHLPTFGQLRRREDRKFLESRQFGPNGADHLFLFTRSDLRLLLPPQAVLERPGTWAQRAPQPLDQFFA